MSEIYQIPASTFWTLLHDEAINGLIDGLATYPDAVGVVRYECEALDSNRGDSFVIFGPSNTLKSLDDARANRPHWSMKATSWGPAPELRETQPARYVRPLPPCPAPKGPMPEPSPEGIVAAKAVAAHLTGKGYVTSARPAMVVFGQTVAYGAFYAMTETHEKDRFVEHGVVKEGDTETVYHFYLVGPEPDRPKTYLHWKHGLPYGPGRNADLAEWYMGGYYPGPTNEYHPFGPNYLVTEHVPMDFGPYKNSLLDDGCRTVKRQAMRVLFLD